MKKHCVVCGKIFETKRSNQICCSETCKFQRKKEISAKYVEEHKEDRKEYFKEYERTKRHRVEDKKEVKPKKNDPEWIKKYQKADRLTKISMLARALSDYGIVIMTYGALSIWWNSARYNRWEKQVFRLKRQENE